jgi:hypothetical protein
MKADYQQRVRSQRSSAAERVLRSMNAAELQLPAKEPQKIEAGRHNRRLVAPHLQAIVFRRAGRRGAESTVSGKKDLVSVREEGPRFPICGTSREQFLSPGGELSVLQSEF